MVDTLKANRDAVIDLPAAGHQPRTFAIDAEHSLLYVVTRASLGPFVGLVQGSATYMTTVHAFRIHNTPTDLGLEHRWSYRLDGCADVLSKEPRLGIASTGDFLYTACRGSETDLLQTRTNGALRLDFGLPADADAGQLTQAEADAQFRVRYFPFPGEMANSLTNIDRSRDRLFLMVVAAGAKRIYTFDAHHGSYTGSRVLGPANIGGVVVNEITGRVYAFDDSENTADPSKLYVFESGPVPATQGTGYAYPTGVQLMVNPVFDPVSRRVFVRPKGLGVADLRVHQDQVPREIPAVAADPDDATHDIDEDEALFVSHSGEASAFGARVLGVSSTLEWRHTMARLSESRLSGSAAGSTAATVRGRGVVLDESVDNDLNEAGFGGGVPRAHRLPGALAGLAERTFVDSPVPSNQKSQMGPFFEEMQRSRAEFYEGEEGRDTEEEAARNSCDAPGERLDKGSDDAFATSHGTTTTTSPGQASNCERRESAEGSPDAHYDNTAPLKERQEAYCSDPGGDSEDSRPGSSVECDRGGPSTNHVVTGQAWSLDEAMGSVLRVAHAESSVHMERDVDEGGIVSVAESLARGIDIVFPSAGAIHIGEVRAVARSVAAGRPGSAKSTHEISINQVRIEDANGTVFACGWDTDSSGVNTEDASADDPDGRCDPAAVVSAMNELTRVFPLPVEIKLAPRERDPKVVATEGGARASITKDKYVQANDDAMNGDDSQEVPSLQITVFNELNNTAIREPTREVIQLAAVRTEALYQIGIPAPEGFEPGPASLTVSLSDGDGAPLAGGAFEVQAPAGGGGLSCTTGDDGVGDCRFPAIPPGDYTVAQTSAPAGYVAATETATATIFPGGSATVDFVNVPAEAAVSVGLLDARTGGPLGGGTFALFADNGDQALGVGDEQIAECTTGGAGACGFERVPLGPYVLHQSGAPDGYEPADDIAFSLTSPGQTAAVRVVNSRVGTDEASVAGVELISSSTGGSGPSTQVRAATPPAGGDLYDWVKRTLGEAAHYLIRNPWQALLFGAFWLLIGSPAYLALRRRDLRLAKEMF